MSNMHAQMLLLKKPQGTKASLVRKHINNSFSVQAVITGNPTEAVLEVSGSLDNIHFKEMVTHTFEDAELVDAHTLFHIINKPVGTIQVTIISLAGGIIPTMSVYIMESV